MKTKKLNVILRDGSYDESMKISQLDELIVNLRKKKRMINSIDIWISLKYILPKTREKFFHHYSIFLF